MCKSKINYISFQRSWKLVSKEENLRMLLLSQEPLFHYTLWRTTKKSTTSFVSVQLRIFCFLHPHIRHIYACSCKHVYVPVHSWVCQMPGSACETITQSLPSKSLVQLLISTILCHLKRSSIDFTCRRVHNLWQVMYHFYSLPKIVSNYVRKRPPA